MRQFTVELKKKCYWEEGSPVLTRFFTNWFESSDLAIVEVKKVWGDNIEIVKVYDVTDEDSDSCDNCGEEFMDDDYHITDGISVCDTCFDYA